MNIADAFFYGANSSPYAAPAAGTPTPQQPIQQAPQPWYMQGRIGRMTPMVSAGNDGFTASGMSRPMFNSLFQPQGPRRQEPAGPFHIPNEPLIPIGS